MWDHLFYSPPVREVADPWIVLTAVALATARVRLGPMITPLDRLSGGRLVLGAGLGSEKHGEFAAIGADEDPIVRARLLDDALDFLGRAWRGEPVAGAHALLPTPLQQPSLPVWIGCRWPHRTPLRRAERWDGVFPVDVPSPDPLAEFVAGLEVAGATWC